MSLNFSISFLEGQLGTDWLILPSDRMRRHPEFSWQDYWKKGECEDFRECVLLLSPPAGRKIKFSNEKHVKSCLNIWINVARISRWLKWKWRIWTSLNVSLAVIYIRMWFPDVPKIISMQIKLKEEEGVRSPFLLYFIFVSTGSSVFVFCLFFFIFASRLWRRRIMCKGAGNDYTWLKWKDDSRKPLFCHLWCLWWPWMFGFHSLYLELPFYCLSSHLNWE